ncbi:hypothetical protein RYX36_021063 [Vicia faba]
MAQPSSSLSPLSLDAVDDVYFSVVSDDETDPAPVSDHKYAEALQFQEALMSSVITSSQPPLSLPCVASSSRTVDEESLFNETLKDSLITSQYVSSSTSPPSPPLLRVAPSSSKAVEVDTLVTKEDERTFPIIICEICAEPKTDEDMFRNKRCYHSFCSDCVVKQVATKIQENITVVSCPGLNCKGVLELETLRPLLPKELIDRWDDAMTEALLLTVPKFYCPFKDCSAMLLDEDEEGGEIRESECPFCHRLFCARCHVSWHPGVSCEEFQTLNVDERGREDLLVRELANQKKWKRCSKCRFYVEKKEGCLHITCRCKYEFCYACGEQWTTTHGECRRN